MPPKFLKFRLQGSSSSAGGQGNDNDSGNTAGGNAIDDDDTNILLSFQQQTQRPSSSIAGGGGSTTQTSATAAATAAVSSSTPASASARGTTTTTSRNVASAPSASSGQRGSGGGGRASAAAAQQLAVQQQMQQQAALMTQPPDSSNAEQQQHNQQLESTPAKEQLTERQDALHMRPIHGLSNEQPQPPPSMGEQRPSSMTQDDVQLGSDGYAFLHAGEREQQRQQAANFHFFQTQGEGDLMWLQMPKHGGALNLASVGSGRVGKMKVYKSGRTVLEIDGVPYDIAVADGGVAQNVVAIVPSDDGTQSCYDLGATRGKMVCTPTVKFS